MESTHCFMLLHHMHSELLLVHSPQAVRKAHGVRHCLALWFAEDETQKGHCDHPPCQLRSKTVQMKTDPLSYYEINLGAKVYEEENKISESLCVV